ncbi:MAG: hypothetical protein JWN85_3760 [Gammaproteobacteria bacterium]|nr:hypothetical protein [Gammaproteobacteria bacterium]
MVTRMIMGGVMMHGARGIRIAQHDLKAPLDRSKHEARRYECAKAQHRENQRRGPMAPPTVSQSICCSSHTGLTMPERPHIIK